jgi:hypothetical protein
MYTAVYETMVEAGVAIKLDTEVMFDRDGKITDNQNELFGRKTRYKLIRPKRCVYVDTKGCNTNMKEPRHIGGHCYIMASDQPEGACTGITNDIHFTALAFTLGTGEPIMCSVII